MQAIVERSQTRISPSQAPDRSQLSLVGCFDMLNTPSVWPSRAPTNGFAKTRSSFVAFSARWYSRGASNGCKRGSALTAWQREGDEAQMD